MALSEGRLIEAIKAIREAEQCDLATAKSRVEAALAADPAAKAKFDSLAKARRKTVIGWVIVVDFILFAAFAWWWFNGRHS